ncbi:hypothetical protein BLOT_015752 [Blomia tropicalis]|nr:hypothetical protein BLOT_015752 [Blomia tropicalis]
MNSSKAEGANTFTNGQHCDSIIIKRGEENKTEFVLFPNQNGWEPSRVSLNPDLNSDWLHALTPFSPNSGVLEESIAYGAMRNGSN